MIVTEHFIQTVPGLSWIMLLKHNMEKGLITILRRPSNKKLTKKLSDNLQREILLLNLWPLLQKLDTPSN